jgi:AcrR family transcriptional regulator
LKTDGAVGFNGSFMATPQLRTRIRHERILDAALSVFARRGYGAAAVDDIAAEADTSKGGVYFHFPGKQAIFLALLDRTARLLLDRIAERVAAEADPLSKVDSALHTLLDTFGSHRALARLFLVEAVGAGPEFHAKMAEIHGRFISFIKLHLDEAVVSGQLSPLDTTVAATVWFGALNEVVVRWALQDSAPQLARSYPTLRLLLLQSLGAVPAASTERDQ